MSVKQEEAGPLKAKRIVCEKCPGQGSPECEQCFVKMMYDCADERLQRIYWTEVAHLRSNYHHHRQSGAGHYAHVREW